MSANLANDRKVDFEREHRLIATGANPLLYPVPVVEGGKYLIEVADRGQAKLLLFALNEKLIEPSDEAFAPARVHADQRTPVFHPMLKHIVFRFLAGRENNLGHARSVESVVTQAWLRGELDKAQRLLDAQRRCSSCQELGIGEAETRERIERILASMT